MIDVMHSVLAESCVLPLILPVSLTRLRIRQVRGRPEGVPLPHHDEYYAGASRNGAKKSPPLLSFTCPPHANHRGASAPVIARDMGFPHHFTFTRSATVIRTRSPQLRSGYG